MKITMEHKLNDEQKEEFKKELDQALEDLKEQLEQTMASWNKMERTFTYVVVGTGVFGFSFGFVIGKLT